MHGAKINNILETSKKKTKKKLRSGWSASENNDDQSIL